MTPCETTNPAPASADDHALSTARNQLPIAVMGVTGCGKSTVAIGAAKALGATFLEGDDLHLPANIAKMSKGIPLTDEDRLPWLESVAEQMKMDASGVVASCSALKRSYRDVLRAGVGQDILFVHLAFAKSIIAPTAGNTNQFARCPATQNSEHKRFRAFEERLSYLSTSRQRQPFHKH